MVQENGDSVASGLPDVAGLSARLRDADSRVRCEAAKALFEHYRGPLCRHIRCELARARLQAGAGGDPLDSRVQTHVNATLLKLLERLQKGPLPADDDQFLAYLKAIVRNALQSRRRQEMRARTEPADVLEQLGGARPSVIDQLADEEQLQHDRQTLGARRNRLTAAEQALLDLYRTGLSYREIAERLGGSPGQYRARMGRILRKLA